MGNFFADKIFVYCKQPFAILMSGLLIRAPLRLCSRLSSQLGEAKSLSLSSSGRNKPNIPAGFAKIKLKQKAFAVNDGLRVHQKGKYDELGYKVTLLVCLFGVVETVRVIYVLSGPW